jgi:hypothetical protein
VTIECEPGPAAESPEHTKYTLSGAYRAMDVTAVAAVLPTVRTSHFIAAIPPEFSEDAVSRTLPSRASRRQSPDLEVQGH